MPQILAAILTCADHRGRADLPPDAVLRLAGQRDADRQRRRPHPPRGRDAAGRPLEHLRLVRVRRASPAFSLLTKYVIRYRGSPRLQPVEHRAGRRVHRARQHAGRAARLLVGAARTSGMIAGLRRHPRRRAADHPAAAPPRPGGDVLGRPWRSASGSSPASGHCMTARWAFAPVCGFDFWRVIVFSPEVLIFLFFMITDPKTVPAGRVGRVVFGFLVAVTSTLLMAPQTDEFGTKVALLGWPGRHVRGAADPRSAAARAAIGGGRPAAGSRPGWRPAVSAGAGIAPRWRCRVGLDRCRASSSSGSASSSPARRLAASSSPDTAEVLDRVPHRRRPGDLPVDHRRAGRRRLGPRDRRVGGPGDRPDPGREPRAREPGPAPRRRDDPRRRRPRRSPRRDAGPAAGRDRDRARPSIDRYQIDDVERRPCSCRSAARRPQPRLRLDAGR